MKRNRIACVAAVAMFQSMSSIALAQDCNTNGVIDSDELIGSPYLHFDGGDDYAEIDRPVEDDFTIEFWFRSTQFAGGASQWWQGRGLVDAEVGGPFHDFGTSLGAGRVMFGCYNSTTGLDVTIQSGVVADGLWRHAAAVRVKSTGALTLYINGQQIASGTSGTQSLNSAEVIHFGNLQTGNGFYEGDLDEIRIWNIAMSQSDIQSTMNTALEGDEAGLVGYWNLDEGSGDIAADSAGENDAFLFNGPAWGFSPSDCDTDGMLDTCELATFVLNDDFNAGLPEGWTTTGLWHVTSNCQQGEACDGGQWAYYGQDSTCNYNVGYSTGVLTAPQVSIPANAVSAKLVYCSYYYGESGDSNESGHDWAWVTANGEELDDVSRSNGVLGTWGEWETRTVDLASYIGQTLDLAWHFDTVDGIVNNSLGWQVDHVRLFFATALDCNSNGAPDECDLDAGNDCNTDGVPDDCQDIMAIVEQGPGDLFSYSWAQDFSDDGLPELSTKSWDDFTIAAPRMLASGAARFFHWADLNFGEIPFLVEIADAPGGAEAGANVVISVPGVGRSDGSGIVDFELESTVLPAGTWWISVQATAFQDFDFVGWMRENLGAPNGSEHYDHNPGGGNGFGTEPIPGSEIYDEPADLAFSLFYDNDCQNNGVPDACDVDCNTDATPDDCQPIADCNTNDIPDECDLAAGTADCNTNSVPDACEDCNTNGVGDACEPGGDCDGNGIADECGPLDCDTDGVADECDAAEGTDCNTNFVPDECELGVLDTRTLELFPNAAIPQTGSLTSTINIFEGAPITDVDVGIDVRHTFVGALDVSVSHGLTTVVLIHDVGSVGDNFTGTLLDESSFTPVESLTVYNAPFTGTFNPIGNLNDFNGVNSGGQWRLTVSDDGDPIDTGTLLHWSLHLDEAPHECNTNGVPDECDIASGESADCDTNGVPDECDIITDCNTNSVLDICDLLNGDLTDCNANGLVDECEGAADCNTNGVPDTCDIGSGVSGDCNVNGAPDECDTGIGLTVSAGDYIATPDMPFGDFVEQSDIMKVAEDETFDDLNVDVVVTHPFMGHTRYRLDRPGTTVVLMDHVGGPSDDANILFDDEAAGEPPGNGPLVGTFQPAQALGAFDADGTTGGNWRMRCLDTGFMQGTGILNQWSLHFTRQEPLSDDCDSNSVPDECEDCNTNGIGDACGDDGELADCNTNGILDICDTAPFVMFASENLTPLKGGVVHSFSYIPVTAYGPVTVTLEAKSDFHQNTEHVDSYFNGSYFNNGYNFYDCEPSWKNIPLSAEQYNAMAGNYVTIDLYPSSGVNNPETCTDSYVNVTVRYDASPLGDCNTNSVPDECDALADDCDSNAVPDACEPDCDTDGVTDACETDCNTNAVPDDCDGDAFFGQSPGLPETGAVSMNLDDTGFPEISIKAWDDFVVASPVLAGVGSAPFYPLNWGGFGTVAFLVEIADAPGGADAGASVSFSTIGQGRTDGSGLVDFDFGGIMLEAGTWWFSVQASGGFNSYDIVSWQRFSFGTYDGFEHYYHNPGGGWGYGSGPFPASQLNGFAADLAFVLGVENDCNTNGVHDVCDIADGDSLDFDDNGIPDECLPVTCTTCPGDTNADGQVDGADIQAFLDCVIAQGNWSCTDLDGDGVTADNDLTDDLAGFVAKLLTDADTACP